MGDLEPDGGVRRRAAVRRTVLRGRRRFAVAGALMLSVAALAGCGSSSSSSSSSAAPAAAASSTSGSSGSSGATGSSGSTGSTGSGGGPAKGAPITIGTICSCSGPLAAANGLEPSLDSAWSKYVNANGGINGHPVKIIVKDDADSATNALADVKSLIQSKVLAIVGEASNFDSDWAPIAQKANIPVIGGQPYDPPMFSNPDFFPTGGDIQALSYGLGADMKKAGQSKVSVMYCLELAACAENPKLFKTMFSTLPSLCGMSVDYSTGVGPSQSSYIAPCLGAKSAGSTAIFYNAGPDFLPNVLDACQQQGVTAGAYTAGAVTSPTLFADSNADGLTLTEYNQSVFNTTTPAMKLFNTIISKYAPNINPKAPAWNDSLTQWFAGLQMFKLAATKAKLTPSSTTDDLKNALWTVKGETLDGLAPPLTYVKNKPTVVSCWFTEQIKGGKEVQPFGDTAQCVPKSDVPGLTKAFS